MTLRPALALLPLAPLMISAQEPPVIIDANRTASSGPFAQRWVVGEISCDGQVATPSFVARPTPAIVYGGYEPSVPITLRFTVDQSGRPMDIAKVGSGWALGVEDLAPALAASRFAAGAPRQDCRATYRAIRAPFSQTPMPELLELSFRQNGVAPPWALSTLLNPTGGGCARPQPAVALRAFPDRDKVTSEPGVVSYSLAGFDLDRSGRPRGVHTVTGTGNESLDRATVRAVAASRYYNHAALTQCRYGYAQRAAVLPGPMGPKAETLRPLESTCPATHRYARYPQLTYPQPFQRRSIEGWAIIGYDVAPWGELGAMRVLAAEPAEAFGEQGEAVLATARYPASTTGYVGCVEKVVFRMAGQPGVAASVTPVVD